MGGHRWVPFKVGGGGRLPAIHRTESRQSPMPVEREDGDAESSDYTCLDGKDSLGAPALPRSDEDGPAAFFEAFVDWLGHRRDKTTGKPYHSNQNEGPVIAEIASDSLEMSALMTTVKSLATAVTCLFSAVTLLQARQHRDRHCYVCGEIGLYAHMPVIDGR